MAKRPKGGAGDFFFDDLLIVLKKTLKLKMEKFFFLERITLGIN
jgi:hypothetical protein